MTQVYAPRRKENCEGWADGQGYRQVFVGGQQMREHDYIAMLALGRELLPGEVVHHIDGNRANNEPENLAIVTRGEHGALHRRPRDPKRVHRMEPHREAARQRALERERDHQTGRFK